MTSNIAGSSALDSSHSMINVCPIWQVDYQVDLWAAGIILYEVSQGEHPFIHHNGRVTAQEVNLRMNGFLSKKDRFKPISPAITKILNALLQENPTMRYIDVQGIFVRR